MNSVLKSISDTKILVSSLITALLIGYFINPFSDNKLQSWDRTFSSSVMNGFSINSRITSLYLFLLVFLPIAFVISNGIYSYVCAKRDSYKEIFLKFNLIFSVPLAIGYFTRYTGSNYSASKSPLILMITVYVLFLLIVGILDLDLKINFDDLLQYFIVFAVLTVCIQTLLITDIIIAISISLVFLSLLLFTRTTAFANKNAVTIKNFLYLTMCLPLVIRVSLEIIYACVEKGTLVSNLRLVLIIIAILSLLFFWIFAKKQPNKNYKSIGYISLVIGLSLISYFQFAYKIEWNYGSVPDLYELGNNTVAVDSFLMGKLPLVDYFSAHALTDVWTGLLYSYVHSDYMGIIANPYSGLNELLSNICVYFLIKKAVNEDTAIMCLLLIPLGGEYIFDIGLSCFTILFLLKLLKENKYCNNFLFWLSALVGLCIKYDEGFAVGVACILCYLLLGVLDKDLKRIITFISTGISTGILALVSLLLYCRINGINAWSRLKEWISVSAGSSSSWATLSFGDAFYSNFTAAYFIVPILVIIMLVVACYLYKTRDDNRVIIQMMIAFGIANLLFINRMIVYHNLVIDGALKGTILNYANWTFALFALLCYLNYSRKEKHVAIYWMMVLGGTIVVLGSVINWTIPSLDQSLFSKSVLSAQTWTYEENLTLAKNDQRIVFDEETERYIGRFKLVFDTLLTEDQTFIDFANVTSLYALTNRERPCYVGQTPSLLTNLYSQECYLDEISQYDCPLVVMGTTAQDFLQQMIGIPHNIRYYRIAEYLYSQYRPLVNFDEYSIWCREDLREAYIEQLLAINIDEIEDYSLVDYGYDVNSKTGLAYEFHDYNLYLIPYIWANIDEMNAISNEVVESLIDNGNYYSMSGSDNLYNSEGNYLHIRAYCEEERIVQISLSDSHNEEGRYSYSFTAVPGENDYLFRISSDYFWNAYVIDTVQLSDSVNFEITQINILAGD
ncbi:MAG: hypothetical protein MJ094_05310 [Saccharofermentans sp.]|nr:hypothetical protein [Saccharofermentans sp.]